MGGKIWFTRENVRPSDMVINPAATLNSKHLHWHESLLHREQCHTGGGGVK